MSVIRRYGISLFNLVKANNITVSNKTTLMFNYPQSDNERWVVSVPDAEEELNSIQLALTRYYSKDRFPGLIDNW